MVELLAIVGGAAALYSILKPRAASEEEVKKIAQKIVQEVPAEHRAALAQDTEAIKALVAAHGLIPLPGMPKEELTAMEMSRKYGKGGGLDPSLSFEDWKEQVGLLPEHVPNEIIVGFEDGIDADHGVTVLQAKYPELGLSLKTKQNNLAVLNTSDVLKSKNLSAHPLVKYAEPNFIARAF